MTEYIDKSALYEKIAQREELARNRYLDTPTNSPCYSRYMAQLNERTALKHLIANFPAAEVAPVVHGRWVEYPRAYYFKCSNCKYTVPHRKAKLFNGKRDYNYCPHCGAKMDGE